MNKKTGLQFTMVLVVMLISLWFYLKYFTKKFEDTKEAPFKENIDKNQKEQAINMIECYSNLFYNEPEFVSYKLVDLETVFYTWLY